MYLVLVTTSANQPYIFASNRLREAVGASGLLADSTTDWVREAASAVGGSVLQESSGSTLAIVPDERAARGLSRAVTSRALRDAPGLSIRAVHQGVAGDPPTPDEIGALFDVDRRQYRSSPAARFARLPMVAGCRSTDLPAARWHTDSTRLDNPKEPPQPLSAEAIAKRAARLPRQRELAALAGRELVDIDRFFDVVEWVGVVHIDGNRLGEFFRHAAGSGGDTLRAASDAVAWAAGEAFTKACTVLPAGRAKLVPLIIGGDDLTALVDGRDVLPFVERYLTNFAERAAAREPIPQLLRSAGRPALTATAGIALVKPHFPFSVAYQLAEELGSAAKRVAAEHPGAHGLDVHVLIDSIVTDPAAVRARYDGGTRRPYLLGDSVPPERDWTDVRRRIEVLAAAPRRDGVLTRAQLHKLRREAHTDPELAHRRLADLAARIEDPADRERLDALGDAVDLRDLLELMPFVSAPAGVST